jgi:integration host factor subunit beta
MNKMDIINKLATDINVNQKIAKIAVDTIIDSIKKAITKDERVEIRGFGSFTLREYKAYRGRNPKSGETVNVEPKKLPYFKVGKELKEMIWKEGPENT